jgi:hypothetical protein
VSTGGIEVACESFLCNPWPQLSDCCAKNPIDVTVVHDLVAEVDPVWVILRRKWHVSQGVSMNEGISNLHAIPVNSWAVRDVLWFVKTQEWVIVELVFVEVILRLSQKKWSITRPSN